MTGKTLRTLQDLSAAGLISTAGTRDLTRVADRYALAIPQEMAALIDRTDPADPIARQFLPDLRELDTLPAEDSDPIGDDHHTPVKGIVHRYPDRVLLKVVHVCPVYCRFCFRREMVGPGNQPSLTQAEIGQALSYVRAHPAIREVILTGGDPLIMAPHRVSDLTQKIATIRSVHTIRWHTRVPVVEPSRITDAMAQALRSPSQKIVVALHANHSREFSPAARFAISRLKASGLSLLSQSVLLRGVNDCADVLHDLLQAFIANGIMPYYLHHADLARGTGHFRTTIAEGLALMQELHAARTLPQLPAYVLDLPGGYSKVNLESDAAVQQTTGHWRLRDDSGQWHDYREDPALFR